MRCRIRYDPHGILIKPPCKIQDMMNEAPCALPYDVSWWYQSVFFVSYTILDLIGLTHGDRDILAGRHEWTEKDLDISRIFGSNRKE
jgi:hypothetical protein